MHPATNSVILSDNHGLYGVHFGVPSVPVRQLGGIEEAFGLGAYHTVPAPKKVFLRSGLFVRYDSSGTEGYLLFTGRHSRAADEESLAQVLLSIPGIEGGQALATAWDADTFGLAVRQNNQQLTNFFFDNLTRGEMVARIALPELGLAGLVIAHENRLQKLLAARATSESPYK